MFTYLKNHYQKPAQLVVPNMCVYEDGDDLVSDKGCTQGDVAAMFFYAAGVKPLIDILDETCCQDLCKQSWYADDCGAIGWLLKIKKWWDILTVYGPKFGYYPKPQKTILLVKHPKDLSRAQEIFHGTGVQIQASGNRYLGAAIGSETFKQQYVSDKVSKWVQDLEQLSAIAVEEPQLALAAYTKGICHRWSFLQRTVEGISPLFKPLEECIRESLLPAIIGRKISDLERRIFSLPVRYGGLGVANPVETCEREYSSSKAITEDLSRLMFQQVQDISQFNKERQESVIRTLKSLKGQHLSAKFDDILGTVTTTELKRNLILNKEKGAGTWLTVLPLKDHAFSLNKREFRDSLCVRYGWAIPNMPHFCGCGAKNDLNHTLICKKGGYVAMRHNNLRDLNADLQREVCRDVVVEPPLLPINNEEVEGTQADRAAPDISSRGLWSTFERTFFDVRVLHPNAPSYSSTDIDKLYKSHEQEKMRKYNSRIISVERGTFTPLVYSTFGGWAPQTTRYHKRLAERIASKRNEAYSDVLNHMRARVRFSLLRSVLVAVRGERGKRTHQAKSISSTCFNLVPSAIDYESF